MADHTQPEAATDTGAAGELYLAGTAAAAEPLCVDLDGTLVKSDTLVDSVLVLARQSPRCLLALPGWLAGGKAAFKQKISSHAPLDVARLPYNQELLDYLREQHAQGREIYLATGADAALAERVAAYLGIFSGVLASDGAVNLTGRNKLAAFQSRFAQGFSYIGNATPDIHLLTACLHPMVANPHRGLLRSLRAAGVQPIRTFRDAAHPAKAWLKVVRLHQWAKNTLIFLPLLLAHVRSPGPMAAALLAFLSFGLAASATYILNDLLDLEADRHHPRKRRRPFAAGDVSPFAGIATIGVFVVLSFVAAVLVPHALGGLSPHVAPETRWRFIEWLGVYAVSTTAYSLWLKRMVLVDVIVLSGLYTIRILAGAAATAVPISPWLAAFSIFFFLSLAFVKRFSELESLRLRTEADGPPGAAAAAGVRGRGYVLSDLEQLRSFGTASGYASVVVFALYIGNLSSAELYRHNGRLWLLVPVLLLWLSRLWLLASRDDLHEDPVVYAITDKRSLLLGAAVVGIVLSAV
ncbi:MAG: UbiA family prenyltransferase [Acidobacteriota bacterium]|nr:UbiA family prenyltransferase [Acidobacteriota bacterium]